MISFDIYVLVLGSDAITYWLSDTPWRRLHDEPEVAAVAVERQLLLRLSTLSEALSFVILYLLSAGVVATKN